MQTYNKGYFVMVTNIMNSVPEFLPVSCCKQQPKYKSGDDRFSKNLSWQAKQYHRYNKTPAAICYGAYL